MSDSKTENTNKPPAVLYRYCSEDEFYKTLENGNIWLTDIWHFNDTLEGNWFTQSLTQQYEKIYNAQVEFNPAEQFLDIFSYCLSEKEDLLSQWSMYANNGEGFCIGYDSAYLNQQFDRLITELSSYRAHRDDAKLSGLFKVAYGDAPASRLAEQFMENVKNNRTTFPRDQYPQVQIARHCATTKNPAFSAEQEWRYIESYTHALADQKYCKMINFRGSNPITPYIERELTNLQSGITTVTLGPRNPLREKTLKFWLLKHNYIETTIHRSTASYR